jgi:hypothetical protein
MTGQRTSSTSIQKGPNCHRITVCRQRNRDAELVTCRLSINVSANLTPSAVTKVIHSNVTSTGTIAIIQ